MEQYGFVFFYILSLFDSVSLNEAVHCQSAVYCDGELLELVQTRRVFDQSKTFVDMPMAEDPDVVLAKFDNWTSRSTEGLPEFINMWFRKPGSDLIEWTPPDWQERPKFIDTILDIEYQNWLLGLNNLWKQLGKQVAKTVSEYPERHSLLPVDNPFIVSSKQSREFYYWDSYWIVRGLLLCGMADTTRGMLLNLAQLIEQFGFVPSGSRLYYSTRSHPPLLTWMVHDYYQLTKNVTFLRQILPFLDREYEFWMANRSIEHDECTVNQYFSIVGSPRPEWYVEDMLKARSVPQDKKAEVYSNLAAGTESGWDLSSRWFVAQGDGVTVRTEQVLPVDLNSFIGVNEIILGQFHMILGASNMSAMYTQAWNKRRQCFDKIFWNEQDGKWSDRLLDTDTYLPGFYASSLTPLYMWKMADAVNLTREMIVFDRLIELGVFDYLGGLPTSLNTSSEQEWDFPYSHAPLQWFLVMAWFNSSSSELRQAARQAATTWLTSTYTGWLDNDTMFEKYNCTLLGEPGNTVSQVGYGWTNAIVMDFLHIYPDSSSQSYLTSSDDNESQTIIITLIVLLCITLCAILVTIPCVIWCRWIYMTGKKRYWARVRHEQVLHSTGGERTHSLPSVYENIAAKEWTDTDPDYQR